ncbi:cyclic pyranopterin monophosphate synthase MoaC [SAR202 cluster bacterium AD-804-J14_MRT_500m]|nr:cyclic pyranopterin monophosphate synthase MoaC [SAR202 cluster bacterium AD-804-J14_MRT_500m]
MQNNAFTHLDNEGKAQMVNVGGKPITQRVATACGSIFLKSQTLESIVGGDISKGDVLATARLAGIMAAKQTPSLIPLCHPLPLDQVTVNLEPDVDKNQIVITATVQCTSRTGVEMEALTAVSITALTVYDMCKSVDRGMQIGNIRLVSKRGGKSGEIVLE